MYTKSSELVPIAPAEFGAWRPHVAKWLAEIVAGSGGTLSERTLTDAILAGDYWLAAIVDDGAPPRGAMKAGQRIECRAAVVSQPVHYKTGLSVLEMIGFSGVGRADWTHLEEHYRALGKALGFQRVKAIARPGWSRVLGQRGWTTTHHIIERDLD